MRQIKNGGKKKKLDVSGVWSRTFYDPFDSGKQNKIIRVFEQKE
jgi:hypothetical protein